jgi:hypothetical protein
MSTSAKTRISVHTPNRYPVTNHLTGYTSGLVRRSPFMSITLARRGSLSIAELRRNVTEAIRLENAVLSGTADLSAFTSPHPAVFGPNSDQVEAIRLRALGRVMSSLIGPAPSGAVSGWWIPKMSAVIGDRPGLHMDARDALTARFER